jgi:hypothetical protein
MLMVLELATLCSILALILLRHREFWAYAPNVFAGAAALLIWSLVFSPVFWVHYGASLAPFWGLACVGSDALALARDHRFGDRGADVRSGATAETLNWIS